MFWTSLRLRYPAPVSAKHTALSTFALLGLSALIGSAHRHVDAWAPVVPATEESRFLPSGRFLGVASLGYRAIAADLLWIRAVMLFGDRIGRSEDSDWYGWLYHMVDLATDLDPEFRIAYKYGGIMLRLGETFVDQSSMIFAKGHEALPQEWYFPSGIGMNYYLHKGESPETAEVAARYIKEASVLPGAPFYLRNFAATLLSKSADPAHALEFVVGELADAPPGKARDAMTVKKVELEWEVARFAAERVIESCATRWSERPKSPQDALDRGCELPSDPFGGSWVWDLDRGSQWSLTSSRYEAVMEGLSVKYGLGRRAMDKRRGLR